MANKIFYLLGAIAAFFPLVVLDFPIIVVLILTIVLIFIGGLLPPLAAIIEAVFWALAIVAIFSQSFSIYTIIFLVIFVYWIISTIPFNVSYCKELLSNLKK